MSSEKATAIVLRTSDFSESSLVVTLFSREMGKVRALAKGAKRLKGPFEGALDLLGLCRIVFLRKSSEGLDLLTEAKLLRCFRPAGHDLGSLYGAFYTVELLDDLTHDYDPQPDLFDLADDTLAALSAGEPVARRVLRFELGMLRILGHLPALESCAECGRPIAIAGRLPFAPIEGGLLCGGCRPGKTQVAVVTAAAVRIMAQLASSERQAWRRLEIDRRVLGELRGIMNFFIAHLLGKKPKMHRFLKSLN